LVAALSTGRRYLGIEIEQKYCALARERLAFLERNPPSRGILSPALYQPISMILQPLRLPTCVAGSAIATITISPRLCDRRWRAFETDEEVQIACR